MYRRYIYLPSLCLCYTIVGFGDYHITLTAIPFPTTSLSLAFDSQVSERPGNFMVPCSPRTDVSGGLKRKKTGSTKT